MIKMWRHRLSLWEESWSCLVTLYSGHTQNTSSLFTHCISVDQYRLERTSTCIFTCLGLWRLTSDAPASWTQSGEHPVSETVVMLTHKLFWLKLQHLWLGAVCLRWNKRHKLLDIVSLCITTAWYLISLFLRLSTSHSSHLYCRDSETSLLTK